MTADRPPLRAFQSRLDKNLDGLLVSVRNPIHRGCFSLIYACGLRIGEAATLPVTAIDKASGLLRVVGKGNKERVVPGPKAVHESLCRMW